MSSANTHTHNDLIGRILAVLVFLIGIGLLCFVFSLAWSLFRSPVPGLELPVKPGSAAPPAAGIGVALTAFARQLLLLAIMIIAGSLIAGKGIHLYFSASNHVLHSNSRGAASKNGVASISESAPSAKANSNTPSD